MKKILLLSTLLCFAFLLKAQLVTHAEMLGRPTDQSVTVQLFFADSAEVAVQYGTAAFSYTGQTPWQSFAPGEPAEIVVSGLTANTTYYYRVRHRVPGSGSITNRSEGIFHTQRPAGSTFSFVVQADPHLDAGSDTALYSRCLNNQLEDNADFMIDLGDFLMSDKLKNAARVVTHDTITYRCHLLRSFYEKVNHSLPLFIALGNHEGEAGWNLDGTANNIAIWGTQDRQKYFLNPAPDGFYSGDTMHHNYVGLRENYYAWNWGDALFIVLDPYWYSSPKPDSLHGWNWTLGKGQYDWLKYTLEHSNATFKFVFAHQIIGGDPQGRGGVEFADRYEWGGRSLDSSYDFATYRPGWYKPIKDLLTEHRVNIFFHGHDHFFGKQEKDCLIYQETPQPSLPNFVSSSAMDYGYLSGQILPNSGHLKVTVSPTGVQVDYVRAYLPASETPSRHNKDVSASYFIGAVNCYDSLSTGVPVLWNSKYSDELVYPNPFAEQIKIEFNVETSRLINLDIYAENGTFVRRLIANTKVPAGDFQVIWDGKDGLGSLMPNGTYLYSLKQDGMPEKRGKLMMQH